MQTQKLRIEEDGAIILIYSDDAAELIEHGAAVISRASNVEPGPAGGWVAEMVDGRARLGPFKLRAEALAAEVEYLEAQLF